MQGPSDANDWTKTCTKCGVVKPAAEFYKSKLGQGGRRASCRGCDRAADATALERSRRYRARHPDKALAAIRKWARENPEKKRESDLRHYRENSDKRRANTKRWVLENPERNRDRMREYLRKHPEKVAENNATRRSLCKSERYTADEWAALKKRFDYACLRCGAKEPDIKLHADHVVPLSQGGRNAIENIQPLCAFCNQSKHTKTADYRPGGAECQLISSTSSTKSAKSSTREPDSNNTKLTD